MSDARVGRAAGIVALGVLEAGCALAPGSHLRPEAHCPVGLMAVCDARGPGIERYSACRCVSRGDIESLLRDR